ncbi:[FeFe] hydrogenase, group A [Cellulomonas soli]|uniref:[FeFe] hydrogenase, group A n=1 Tax=Cellulomonas soli TaxID=931535 RepID=UPI003F85801C
MTAPRAPAAGGVITDLVAVDIDGRRLVVPAGTTVLDAAAAADVRIPTLCHHPDLRDVGSCRLCVVDVEGEPGPQAACTYPVTDGMQVRTDGAQVVAARRDVLELLMGEHPEPCPECARTGACELQVLATEHGVGPVPERTARPAPLVDLLGPAVTVDLDACIGCLRCVRTCAELQDLGILGVVGRGSSTAVSTYRGLPLAEVNCIACGQCINRCPTGALRPVDRSAELFAALADPAKHVVIQTAPSPRAAIGEEFGLEPGTPLTWQLNTALRRLGFDKVFDTSFAADLTVLEEGAELLVRLYENLVTGESTHPLPLLTSCSPGWVKDLEHRDPQRLGHLSSCRSPQQMFGSLLKTWYAQQEQLDPADIMSVSLMPCTAKKFEATRPEFTHDGRPDVDMALTTRELAAMMRARGIVPMDLPPSDFDEPFGTASGSGVIFGVTGGVMESALRTVIELVTGRPAEDYFTHADITPVRGFDGVRSLEVTLDQVGPVPPILAHLLPDLEWLRGATLRCAVAHGTAVAHEVMEDLRAGGRFSTYHFIEVMACPGGCLGGGGQPVPTNAQVRAARARAIYAEDAEYGATGRARKSHENPAVLRLYREVLAEGPCGPTSHRLLHTRYTARGTRIGTGR